MGRSVFGQTGRVDKKKDGFLSYLVSYRLRVAVVTNPHLKVIDKNLLIYATHRQKVHPFHISETFYSNWRMNWYFHTIVNPKSIRRIC